MSLLLQPAVSAARIIGYAQNVSTQGGPLTRYAPFTITRPNNSTAYAANDVWGAQFQLANVNRRAGGMFSVYGIIELATTVAAPSNLLAVTFGAAPTVVADNAPLIVSQADMANLAGVGSTMTWVRGLRANKWIANPGTLGGVIVQQATVPGRDLWVYIIVNSAYTPDPLESLTFNLWTRYLN